MFSNHITRTAIRMMYRCRVEPDSAFEEITVHYVLTHASHLVWYINRMNEDIAQNIAYMTVRFIRQGNFSNIENNPSQVWDRFKRLVQWHSKRANYAYLTYPLEVVQNHLELEKKRQYVPCQEHLLDLADEFSKHMNSGLYSEWQQIEVYNRLSSNLNQIPNPDKKTKQAFTQKMHRCYDSWHKAYFKKD